MRNLDRYRLTMDYQPVDHPPLMAEHIWPETRVRWESEGLPAGAKWETALGVKTFDLAWHGYNHALHPGFAEELVEETAEHQTKRDQLGRLVQIRKDGSSTPHVLAYPVTDAASFAAFLPRLEGRWEERLTPDWEQRVARFNDPSFDALLTPPLGNTFFTLNLVAGIETISYLIADHPELIERYLDAVVDGCCWFLEQRFFPRVRGCVTMGTGEDIAYKNGPFLSPRAFARLWAPRYRRALEIGRRHGVTHCYVDTDGDFSALLPQCLDLGMDTFCPMEVAAGMDPVAMRQRCGKGLRMVGGFDKRIVAAGPAAIDAEFRRLEPVVRAGGFIPKIDHSVAPDISWDHFRHYIDGMLALHRRLAG